MVLDSFHWIPSHRSLSLLERCATCLRGSNAGSTPGRGSQGATGAWRRCALAGWLAAQGRSGREVLYQVLVLIC